MTDFVMTERLDGDVALVSLNRPEALNSPNIAGSLRSALGLPLPKVDIGRH